MMRLKYSLLVICLSWASSQGCGGDAQVVVSVVPLANGSACAGDDNCDSGHCQNGFCCTTGDCCAQDSDCPASYQVAAQCDTTATCQGTRRDTTCSSNTCGTGPTVDDDTGCTDTTQAKDCSPFAPALCTGDPAQAEPECGPDCSTDDDCATGYHCDSGCQADLDAGFSCDEASDCISAHCQNDFCCTAGDCCSQLSDCPSSYSVPAQCDDTVACQGTRTDATCIASTCATGSSTEDDSACTNAIQSKTCTPYAPASCNGSADQAEPMCAATCTLDTQCVSGFHCDDTCVGDVNDGSACDEASDCISGHCQNDFCCTSGDCCSGPSDCSSHAVPLACDDAATCQGSYANATCVSNICGTDTAVADDSACTMATQAKDCGLYLPVFCNGNADQTEPLCPTSCGDDGECISAAHCDGTCEMDLNDGSGCDEISDCISGHCQNNFCCTSGDCCSQMSDCTVALQCNDATTCQGTRADAICTSNICGNSAPIDDDSGCTSSTPSQDCSPNPPAYCDGTADQSTPSCPTCLPQMVISQIYGAGGNSGAVLTHDFVELHNRGTTAVSLEGWSVQYASSTGNTWLVTELSGSVTAGGFFLIQLAAGATGDGAAMPTPDITGTTNMAATNGKVALVGDTTALSGNCPTGMVDFIGYGTADCYEGAPGPALNTATSAVRLPGTSCTDTDDNSTDFAAIAPVPRNSGWTPVACGC